ncbi:hypothetical protein ACSDBR_01355 [Acidithiobacillus ferriphilus]|uniref:hypothetical protein n=1 Tax=Acidithiobacillus ferriphilus TaxID=1689834 RepID=UPI003F51662C
MRRVSNLAFNQEFPICTGLTGIPQESPVYIRRDRHNPFDPDAVGVWLEIHPEVALGWLYRKDTNRPVVLAALDQGKAITGRVQLRNPGPGAASANPRARQKVVVFWL